MGASEQTGIWTKKHVDDWMEEPAVDPCEELVKNWFKHFRRPAVDHNYAWLEAHIITCNYKHGHFRVVGCSRFGDIWLSSDLTRNHGYQHRVPVEECSNWCVNVRQLKKA